MLHSDFSFESTNRIADKSRRGRFKRVRKLSFFVENTTRRWRGGFDWFLVPPPFHRHPSLQEKNRKRLGGRRDKGFSAKCLPIDFCHWLLLCRRVANVQTWPLSAAYSHAISFDNLLNFVWQFESNSDQLTYLNQLTQFKYLSRYLKLSRVLRGVLN